MVLVLLLPLSRILLNLLKMIKILIIHQIEMFYGLLKLPSHLEEKY